MAGSGDTALATALRFARSDVRVYIAWAGHASCATSTRKHVYADIQLAADIQLRDRRTLLVEGLGDGTSLALVREVALSIAT